MYQTTFLDASKCHPKVRELPSREQPLNRLREVGPSAVSTTELLACLLQTPDAVRQAEELLTRFHTLADLSRAFEREIKQVEGLGSAQAARLKAAFELGRRLMGEALEEHLQVRAPSDAAAYLLPKLSMLEREHFVVVVLDTRNRILHDEVLYTGTLNASIVRVSEVFIPAMQRNCASIIVAHNHPSGDPTPSPEDIALTRRIVEAGKLLEIELLDHLVIGHNRYLSMRERGLGFESA